MKGCVIESIICINLCVWGNIIMFKLTFDKLYQGSVFVDSLRLVRNPTSFCY